MGALEEFYCNIKFLNVFSSAKSPVLSLILLSYTTFPSMHVWKATQRFRLSENIFLPVPSGVFGPSVVTLWLWDMTLCMCMNNLCDYMVTWSTNGWLSWPPFGPQLPLRSYLRHCLYKPCCFLCRIMTLYLSFTGVLMWEVYSLGKMPYGTSTNADVVEHVKRTQPPLERPDRCSADIYKVMTNCWKRVWCF